MPNLQCPTNSGVPVASSAQTAPLPSLAMAWFRACAGLTSVSAQNSGVPVASSARMQPQLHMSIGREYSSAPSSSSGARYSRVWTCRTKQEQLAQPIRHNSLAAARCRGEGGPRCQSNPVWINPCHIPPPSLVYVSSHLTSVRAGSTRVGGPPQPPVSNLDGAAGQWAGSSAASRAVVCGACQAVNRKETGGQLCFQTQPCRPSATDMQRQLRTSNCASATAQQQQPVALTRSAGPAGCCGASGRGA